MSISKTHRRVFLAIGALAAMAQMLPISAQAQSNYPTRPIRFLVGFQPGGSADAVARFTAAEMSKVLGQQVVVENKTGASAHVATQALLSAPADGYTILFAGLTLATNPPLMDNLGYDPDKDLQMVSQLTAMPVVVIVRSDSPLNDLKDLIATAKSKNGLLKFGSGGIGTSSHLGPELLSRVSGFKYTHVPYRGGAPALQSVFSGETEVLFDTAVTPLHRSNLEAGKIKFLGIMQETPLPYLPSVKSAGQQGIPAVAFMRSWQGVAVRSGTPPEIVSKLHASIVKAMSNKELVEKMASSVGVEVQTSVTPADFQKLYKDELTRWTALIKAAGIKAEQ